MGDKINKLYIKIKKNKIRYYGADIVFRRKGVDLRKRGVNISTPY